MAKPKSEAYKLANEIYQRYVDRPGEFVVEQVKLAMREELSPFEGEAFAALIDNAFTKAERRHKQKAENPQLTLFEMGGVFVLENNRRVGMRHAMLAHYMEHLQFDDLNRQRVDAANDRKHLRLELLKPYWTAGKTMEQAVNAYREANPQDDEFAA